MLPDSPGQYKQTDRQMACTITFASTTLLASLHCSPDPADLATSIMPLLPGKSWEQVPTPLKHPS